MIGGIVITHGPMARALIKAAETILGKSSLLHGFSTTDMSLSEIAEKAAKILDAEEWPAETLILVSLKGGSCWRSAISIKNETEKIEVVSGINLSMLLSFITKRDSHQLKELAAVVLQDGIRGIDKY